jgi:phage terminase large subunit
VLQREREKLKEEDYDSYLHVYEGATIQNLEGAVYAKELRAAQLEGRICSVPYEPDVPVDVFWDLGKTNNTALWFVQRVAMQWRILHYYEANREELSHYLKYCQNQGYFYGTMFLPHDAKHRRLGFTGSIEEQVRKSGYNVQIVPATSDNDGINAVRVVFPNCYFDEVGCEDGLDVLRHYCFKTDLRGQLTVLVNSDGADSFKYFAVSTKVKRIKQGRPLEEGTLASRLAKATSVAIGRVEGGLGWMR